MGQIFFCVFSLTMAEEFKCKVCSRTALGNVFQLRGRCLNCHNDSLFEYFNKLNRSKIEDGCQDPTLLKRYLASQIIGLKKSKGITVDKNNLISSSEEESAEDEKDEDFVPDSPAAKKVSSLTKKRYPAKLRSQKLVECSVSVASSATDLSAKSPAHSQPFKENKHPPRSDFPSESEDSLNSTSSSPLRMQPQTKPLELSTPVPSPTKSIKKRKLYTPPTQTHRHAKVSRVSKKRSRSPSPSMSQSSRSPSPKRKMDEQQRNRTLFNENWIGDMQFFPTEAFSIKFKDGLNENEKKICFNEIKLRQDEIIQNLKKVFFNKDRV